MSLSHPWFPLRYISTVKPGDSDNPPALALDSRGHPRSLESDEMVRGSRVSGQRGQNWGAGPRSRLASASEDGEDGAGELAPFELIGPGVGDDSGFDPLLVSGVDGVCPLLSTDNDVSSDFLYFGALRYPCTWSLPI